ncbi:MAG: cell envelope integrity protein CreD [Pseudomonadota bacterium]|nr:cell envelope integrity protein CreD [Pseudomonadota bacterium]
MRLWLKMLLVLGMTLAILIPLTMVRGVIHERQDYRRQAVADIALSYAGQQAFAGPVLVVPYRQVDEVDETDALGIVRKVKRVREHAWTFFPTTLAIEGGLKPDIRRRGLHEVRVYEWHGDAKAAFDVAIPADPGPAHERHIGRPYLGYAIGDVRGLIGTPTLQVGGRSLTVEQGQGHRLGEGLHVRLDALQAGRTHHVQTRLRLVLGGTERLALVPLGQQNRFVLSSSWPHPGFFGSSPRTSAIDASGFKAVWDIPGLASNARQDYLEGRTIGERGGGDAAELAGVDQVGVALVDPVDVYAKTDRATKYGLLFVLLTFIGFFIFELIRQLPIHPIQYGLVGLALAMFFLLLLSLSEHFDFGWSYLAAAVACIGLITFYLSAVLRSMLRALGFAAMLTTLYAVLYGLLISEDNALVLGAGLLFVVLAALMLVTRKVDWYRVAAVRPSLRD